jgi:predicted acyl esterase
MPGWRGSRAAGVGLGVALAMLAAVAARAVAAAVDDGSGVELTWGVKIPLRDGVHLNATLYRPRRAAVPVPALFRLSLYTPDAYHREATDLARHGYAFAAVDVRGRGNSEGSFEPWRNDGRDGADVVEWLARQAWSNGKVGMFGESYLGRAVWSTLKEHPAHLAAAAPIAALLACGTNAVAADAPAGSDGFTGTYFTSPTPPAAGLERGCLAAVRRGRCPRRLSFGAPGARRRRARR